MEGAFPGKKTSYAIANIIISELEGYRKTSLKRADDTTNLTWMIEVLLDNNQSDSK